MVRSEKGDDKMSKISTKGTCQFCHGAFSKSTMTRHLDACPQRTDAITTTNQKSTKQTNIMHLLVEGRDQPQYWMHLELPADVTLQTLDNFLRGIWLECCG